MKYWLLIILCIFINCNQPTKMEIKTENPDKLTSLIESVKSSFAPDKRTAIFDVAFSHENATTIITGETNLPQAKDSLLALARKIDSIVIDSIRVLPDNRIGDKKYGIINLSVSNLRSEPRHSAELATQALLGTPVKIFDCDADEVWFRVQTADEYIAWVDRGGIIAIDKPMLDSWINATKIIYTKHYGFSYSQPDVTSQTVSDLVIGDMLQLTSADEYFYKVAYPDGRQAYILATDAQRYDEWLALRNPTAENIISSAKSFMGIPYLWGGTSAKGLDCSGFTKTVFFLNGILLPRDASQQVLTGELVETNDNYAQLQTGDLLFFGRRATDAQKERITHVAIYMGNGQYIHASGRITINSFDPKSEIYSEERMKAFVKAKRILNSLDKNGIYSLKNIKFDY